MELSRPLLRAVTALNFEAPSLVQQRAIPIALAGRDLCVCAQTGSGKTAAFMLPVLERLMFRPKKVAQTRVMVLSPTRELAVQVCIAPSHGTCTRLMLDEHTLTLMRHSLRIHSFTCMQHFLMPHPLTYHTHSCHTLSCCIHSLMPQPLTLQPLTRTTPTHTTHSHSHHTRSLCNHTGVRHVQEAGSVHRHLIRARGGWHGTATAGGRASCATRRDCRNTRATCGPHHKHVFVLS
jgi:hypothetical protein